MKQILMSILLSFGLMSAACAADPPAEAKPVKEDPAAAPNAIQKEDAVPQAAEQQVQPLAELAWLVGTWVDQADDGTILTRVHWTKNNRFLVWSFVVKQEGKVVLEGTQVIGWDPLKKRIRSWIFDSDGGFGEGYWIRDGNRWLAKNRFVLSTGETASSVNVITYIDDNKFTWQSVDREVGGELLPNVEEVTIVRQKTPASDAKPAHGDAEQKQENEKKKEGGAQ